jgi:integration host factor subunit beta
VATKSDVLVKVTKKQPYLDKMVVATIINMFFEMLSSALKFHNRIEIRGFGSFSIRSYNLKKGSHLMTQKFTKNQYFKVYFRSSQGLSNLINE